MEEKEFKTIEEQLDLLESRGMTIENRAKAASFLLHNNYYRISGYSAPGPQRTQSRPSREGRRGLRF